MELVADLDKTGLAPFGIETLAKDVEKSYAAGEAEIARLILKTIQQIAELRHSPASDVLLDADGSRFAIYTGGNPVAPGDYFVRITPHLAPSSEREVFRSRRLDLQGRYDSVIGLAPNSMESALETAVEGCALMLQLLQRWVETQLYLCLEELSKNMAEGVYRLLGEIDTTFLDRRTIDIAVVGRKRGWRVPSLPLLERTLEALRKSPGRYEADLLSATFVATQLPRDQLLMAKALDSGDAVVLPFRNAPYVISGSYFGIACQLLDGKESDRIHPIFDSEHLGIVLIYPADDSDVTNAVDERLVDIEAFVAANMQPFLNALEFIERETPAMDSKVSPGPGRRLMNAFDAALEGPGEAQRHD